MRTIGLIGGMSAESTTVYYQQINRLVRERLGGLHSAQIAMWSLDFAPIAALQAKDNWAATGAILADAARRLEGAGAEAILICANTMHLNYAEVAAAVDAPVIHIADATAGALKARGVTKALLLATRQTLRRLDALGDGVSSNIDRLVEDDTARQNGLFAVAAMRHPSGAPLVAVAARERGGVLLSLDGGQAGTRPKGLCVSSSGVCGSSGLTQRSPCSAATAATLSNQMVSPGVSLCVTTRGTCTPASSSARRQRTPTWW